MVVNAIDGIGYIHSPTVFYFYRDASRCGADKVDGETRETDLPEEKSRWTSVYSRLR